MNASLPELYRTINDTHRPSLVFNLGSEGGFYSEFNNMVFGILFCLKYHYRFVLYSDAATFKIRDGWTDYFEPFCPSTRNPLHRRINRRSSPPNSRKYRLAYRAYKELTGNSLTFELWNRFFSPEFQLEHFDIPELGINGNLREAARVIVKTIYRFTAATRKAIENVVSPLRLPANYAAINIRRGDKDTEVKYVPIEKFLAKVDSLTDLQDIFVFTDDFSVVEELRSVRPDKRFYTLTSESERGYFHDRFSLLSSSQKYESVIKMFAAIEIMAEATQAIGTFTANPGIFLGMRMPSDKFHSVQRSSWNQFQMDDILQDLHPRFAENVPGRSIDTL